MIAIKTKHGEFKYKDWQWNLAWLLVFLCGVAVGIIGSLMAANGDAATRMAGF